MTTRISFTEEQLTDAHVALIAHVSTSLRYRQHESARASVRSTIALIRTLALARRNASRRSHGLSPFRTFNEMRAWQIEGVKRLSSEITRARTAA